MSDVFFDSVEVVERFGLSHPLSDVSVAILILCLLLCICFLFLRLLYAVINLVCFYLIGDVSAIESSLSVASRDSFFDFLALHGAIESLFAGDSDFTFVKSNALGGACEYVFDFKELHILEMQKMVSTYVYLHDVTCDIYFRTESAELACKYDRGFILSRYATVTYSLSVSVDLRGRLLCLNINPTVCAYPSLSVVQSVVAGSASSSALLSSEVVVRLKTTLDAFLLGSGLTGWKICSSVSGCCLS